MQKSRYVQIPDVITVHLGGKDADAPNITVPFVEYVKGCAGCIICPTWPENAQRANIYAITSFALHRVCNRWYRARGCAFDITASAEEDLPFNGKGCLFYNTCCLVEDMFNNYLTRQGSGDPLPARICSSSQAAAGSGGLCQPEAVAMAEKGSTVYDILRKYYGEDIVMVQNAPRQGERERFLGTPLMRGASGDDICTIKRQLNRIGQNYPAIMPLAAENPDFDAPCERAVRTFQYIFDLPVTGVLDKATWYKIKQTWGCIAQGDADPFAQEAAAVMNTVSGGAVPGNTVPVSPVSDSGVRENAAQEGAVPGSGMPGIIVPGRVIPGNTMPSIIIPGDTTLDTVISDRGIAEQATRDRTSPESTALENVAQWNAMRERIMQSDVPPGSITPGTVISDRGIVARAEAESAIAGDIPPGETMPGTMPADTVPSEVAPGSITPGTVISDRGVAARAEAESAIPGDIPPGETMPDSVARGETPQGQAVQWYAERLDLPPESTLPESPVTAPTSPADHLVKIGPSVSTALPDEGGVDSGHAVEWLRKFYGL